MPVFLGAFTHSLDSKSRLTIPAKYRDFVAEGMVITRHPQSKCLMAMPLAEWGQLAAKVSSKPFTDPASALFRRMFFSAAEDVTPDKQGRILISQRLREMAGIENDVMVAGVDTFFELWNPADWEKTLEPLNDVEMVNQMFSALSI